MCTVFFMNVYILCSLWLCTAYVLYECVLTALFMNVYWLCSLRMYTVFFMNVYCLCSLWVCTDCVLYECVLRSLWMCTDCVLTEAVEGIVEFPDVWRYFVTLCSRLNRLTRFCTVPHFLCPPRQWLDLRNEPNLSGSDPCPPIDLWTLLTFSVSLQTP